MPVPTTRMQLILSFAAAMSKYEPPFHLTDLMSTQQDAISALLKRLRPRRSMALRAATA